MRYRVERFSHFAFPIYIFLWRFQLHKKIPVKFTCVVPQQEMMTRSIYFDHCYRFWNYDGRRGRFLAMHGISYPFPVTCTLYINIAEINFQIHQKVPVTVTRGLTKEQMMTRSMFRSVLPFLKPWSTKRKDSSYVRNILPVSSYVYNAEIRFQLHKKVPVKVTCGPTWEKVITHIIGFDHCPESVIDEELNHFSFIWFLANFQLWCINKWATSRVFVFYYM